MIIRGRFIGNAPYSGIHLRSTHFRGLVWLFMDTEAFIQEVKDANKEEVLWEREFWDVTS